MPKAPPYPKQPTRSDIRRNQTRCLRRLLGEIDGGNPFQRRKLADANLEAGRIRSLDDLRRIPCTSKAEIVADQAANPPYGTNLTYPIERYSRLHQTSGTTGEPIRWLDTPESWQWFLDCWAEIFEIAGLRRDDRLAFPFSFGPFVGFWAAFEGAARLGNMCLPGGGMSSEARLRFIDENRATIICCTPTYALRLAEVAADQGIDLAGGPVRALIVAGEPGGSIAATRSAIERAWGARVLDHWGMTEIGALAVECEAQPGGMHVLETQCIAEIVDPQTLEPVEPGTQGELVVTNPGRIGSPLLRYRTGDLVKADVRPCPCGRELLRLDGGILGRADEMIIIRGNNVFPSSIEAVVRLFEDVAEYRVEVRTVRSMPHLRIEIEPAPSAASPDQAARLVESVGRAVKDRLNFTAEIAAVPTGSLPRYDLKGRRFVRVDERQPG
jgi:phenylacetate-CoA ligase